MKQQNNSKKGKLVIVRHGESEWNATGQWTGLSDVGLTEKGKNDAEKMGLQIKDIELHHAVVSNLKRTHETMQSVLKAHGTEIPHAKHEALNERDYGEYTGLNKWEVKEKVGEEVFDAIRRGWEHPVPGGETLKDVHARVVPFFMAEVLPRLHKGENVLLVAHGNSIRALMKHLEDIADEDMAKVEMVFGTILVYEVDELGKKVSKQERKADIEPTHA